MNWHNNQIGKQTKRQVENLFLAKPKKNTFRVRGEWIDAIKKIGNSTLEADES